MNYMFEKCNAQRGFKNSFDILLTLISKGNVEVFCIIYRALYYKDYIKNVIFLKMLLAKDIIYVIQRFWIYPWENTLKNVLV